MHPFVLPIKSQNPFASTTPPAKGFLRFYMNALGCEVSAALNGGSYGS
jgi:hypothetical protein